MIAPPPRMASPIDEQQAAQLHVRAQEAERVEDVLAEEREVEPARVLGRGRALIAMSATMSPRR